MLCVSRVSPAGIGSYRDPVTVRRLKRDRIRVDAGVVHTSPGRRVVAWQALGMWFAGRAGRYWRHFHDREDFGPEEWGKTLRDHGNRAAVPGRERAAPRSIRASHACGRPRRATAATCWRLVLSWHA